MTTATINIRLIPTMQYATPATGGTVNVGVTGYTCLHIDPAGTLVALTVSLPSSPQDGDTVEISSSQIVTGLTMNNGTIIGALTTMAVGTFAAYRYSADATKWFRVG